MIINNIYKINDDDNALTLKIPIEQLKVILNILKSNLNKITNILVENNLKIDIKSRAERQRRNLVKIISTIETNIIYKQTWLALGPYDYSLVYFILSTNPHITENILSYFNKNITNINKHVFKEYYDVVNSIDEFLWDYELEDTINVNNYLRFIKVIFDEQEIPYLTESIIRMLDENTKNKTDGKELELSISDDFILKFNKKDYIKFLKRTLHTIEHNFVDEVSINCNVVEFFFLCYLSEESLYYYKDKKIPLLNIYTDDNFDEENFLIDFYKQCKYLTPNHWNKDYSRYYEYKFHEILG